MIDTGYCTASVQHTISDALGIRQIVTQYHRIPQSDARNDALYLTGRTRGICENS